MMKLRLTLLAVLLTVGLFTAKSQNYQNLTEEEMAKTPYWIEMMQDETVNFYDVQKAFNLYWEGRKITKGSGWKPFKRWEYMTSFQINPDGSRRPADADWNEYFRFLNKFPDQKSENGNWSNLGPYLIPSSKGYNGLGRINAIGFHPTDDKTIYIGAPAGGLWVSHDEGQTWSSETDVLPTLGVSAILIDYNNPNIIYIGTGDRDAGDAAGLGIMKSFDGGLTWEMYNNGMGSRVVGRLIMHPSDNDMIFAATSAGICKSEDGGENWTTKKTGNFKEILFKTDDPTIIFASGNGKFYRSIDTGETWEQITSGVPTGERGVIGVSPANPDVVYFLLSVSSAYKGIYRSTDAGLNFTEMSNSPNIMSWGCEGGDGGQAWYDLDIAIDPLNDNTIFAGGVNCFKSTDGGATWQISSHWWGDCGVPAVHADLHVLEYNPHNGKLYAGNDGGIYWTSDGGTSWHEISDGLAISQVYKIGQSATVKDKVINGYQDNGTATFLGTPDWKSVIGGDGMECCVDFQNPLYSYGTLYYGDIFRVLNNTNATKIAGNGTFGITEEGGWITPFLLDVSDPTTMFVGYKNIWRGKNIRSANPQWQKISDGLGGVNSTNMRCMDQSAANSDILYVGRDDKKLFRTDNAHDASPSWVNLSGDLPESNSINAIETHPNDENIVYLAVGNHIYKSTNKGNNWENISGSLPDVSINSIAYYTNSVEGLYVGTNVGIFYKDTFLDDWILFTNGFPASSRVTEVEIYHDPSNPANDMIRAGTYGRGLWESDMYHATPVAGFSCDQLLAPPACPLSFADTSAGVPTAWEWHFEGGTPEISYDRNPSNISFSNAGTYDVTLTVTNELGANTITKTDYIAISDDILPVPDFSVSRIATCSGTRVEFSNLSQYCPTSYFWSFNPASVTFIDGTSAVSENPVVLFNETGAYSVTLTASNTNGQASITREDYIQSGGYAMPFSESFENGFDSKGWTVLNPDNKTTWEIITPTFAPDGTNAAYMNFFAYYLMYERDQLISPPINFEGVSLAELSFKHAYAQRYSQVDSLIVKISDDCGETWQRIYANGPNGSGSFETSEPTVLSFDPLTSADWCGEGYGAECITLELPQMTNQSGLMLMFESFNKLGNNLYIDDIQISTITGMDEKVAAENSIFNIHPNPADNLVAVTFSESDISVKLQITNLEGQKVKTLFYPSVEKKQTESIDVSGWQKGVYFITVSGNLRTGTRPLIVK